MKTSRVRYTSMAAIVLVMQFAMARAAAPAPAVIQVPFRLVGPSTPVVTIRIHNRDIPVELDIGDASALVLQPTALAELNATPTGNTFKGYGMEGKIFEVPIAKVDKVDLGGMVFADVPVHQDGHDDAFRAQQLAERGTRGYIGAGFFKGHELVLDYRRRQITVVSPGAQAESQRGCRGHVIPLESSVSWGLVSRVNTDFGDMLFVWDTGSPKLIMVKANAAAAHLDTTQGSITFEHFRMNGSEFGPLRFDLWDFAAPPGMAGVIGYDFFRDHVVCVDFPRDRILVR